MIRKTLKNSKDLLNVIKTTLFESGLTFLFSDGVEQTIDFASFLEKAGNPITKKYLDKKLFKSYSIEHGDILME